MKKNIRFFLLAVALVLLMELASCSVNPAPTNKPASSSQPSGQIYLYGEQHGVEKI